MPLLLLQIAAVLRALAPNLLELRLGAHKVSPDREDDLLPLLQLLLPTMHLVGLSACPSILDNSTLPHGIDIVPYTDFTEPRFGALTLLRSAPHSAQQPPLSPSLLTRLNLLHPKKGFRHYPLQFLPSFASQLRELHVDFTDHNDAFLVPLAALPPLLTSLFCTNALLLLTGGDSSPAQRCTSRPCNGATDAAVAATSAQPAEACCLSIQHGADSPPSQNVEGGSNRQGGCSPSNAAQWPGLEQLHTLELMGYAGMSPFVGGGLPDLLRHTPNLKRLACPAAFRRRCPGDAARLGGCAPMLTHLWLYRSVVAAEDRGAEAVEQLCEWAGSLRHLRQLHMRSCDPPGPLFAKVRPAAAPFQ
jgi:hypothetical protein